MQHATQDTVDILPEDQPSPAPDFSTNKTNKHVESAPELTSEQEVLALLLHHGRELFRSSEMKQFFGNSRILFQQCRDANWLTTRLSGNRFSGYHLIDIVQCVRRLRREGRPKCRHTKKNKAHHE